jgi:hypothetical protein
MEQLLRHALDYQRRHFFGIYRAIVESNEDQEGNGRLQVVIPAISDQLKHWAVPCVPYAGDGVGFFTLPEKDTNVWVMFEGGDISYPVWMGFCWGSGEVPDPGKAAVKVLKTKAFTVQIDDDAAEMKMTNDTSTVTIGDEIKSECSSGVHTVSSSGVTSEAGKGKVEVTSSSVKVNDGALEVV